MAFVKTKSRIQRTIINTGASTTVKILNLILNFILRTIFIRVLGIQYTGISSLFTSILMVLSLAELGIGSAITFALYKPIAEQNYKQIARLMNFYKIAYRIVALIVFAGGLCLIPFLDVIVKNVPDIRESIELIYILYLVNAASSYLLIYKSVLLTANQNNYIISFIDMMMTFIKIAVECAVIIIFGQFLLYLIIGIIFSIVRNIIVSIWADKSMPEIREYTNERLPHSEKKKLFKDVGALAMYAVSGVVLNGTDDVIISTFLGTSLVGILSNYKLIKASIDGLLLEFCSALTPSVGNLAVEKKDSQDTQYLVYRKIDFINFWVSCFCATCFICLYNPFIQNIWLGKEYTFSFAIVLAIVLDFYLTNMVRPISTFRTANGLFVQGKWRPAIMALVNIFLSIILVRIWGVFGVLIATVIARVLTQLWYDPWLVYNRIFHKSIREYFSVYLVHFIITIICCVVTYVIIDALPFSNKYILFIVQLALCILIPNAILFMVYRRSCYFQFFKQMIFNYLNLHQK